MIRIPLDRLDSPRAAQLNRPVPDRHAAGRAKRAERRAVAHKKGVVLVGERTRHGTVAVAMRCSSFTVHCAVRFVDLNRVARLRTTCLQLPAAISFQVSVAQAQRVTSHYAQ